MAKKALKKKSLTPKLAIICNKVCPANILAKRRTDKLIGLIQYDITSIRIIKGNIAKGTPLGINKLKKETPCLRIPKNVIPKKREKAIIKVNII